jgi:hypothetical protein
MEAPRLDRLKQKYQQLFETSIEDHLYNQFIVQINVNNFNLKYKKK